MGVFLGESIMFNRSLLHIEKRITQIENLRHIQLKLFRPGITNPLRAGIHLTKLNILLRKLTHYRHALVRFSAMPVRRRRSADHLCSRVIELETLFNIRLTKVLSERSASTLKRLNTTTKLQTKTTQAWLRVISNTV